MISILVLDDFIFIFNINTRLKKFFSSANLRKSDRLNVTFLRFNPDRSMNMFFQDLSKGGPNYFDAQRVDIYNWFLQFFQSKGTERVKMS